MHAEEEAKFAERDEIQKQIMDLNEQRRKYTAKNTKETSKVLEDAMGQAIKKPDTSLYQAFLLLLFAINYLDVTFHYISCLGPRFGLYRQEYYIPR